MQAIMDMNIVLVGFSALDPDIDSVVMFMKVKLLKTKYNKDDTVYIQKMQFCIPIEDELFEEVGCLFQKPSRRMQQSHI